MNGSKIDFISNLLAHNNISVAEKERLFLLTKEEVKRIGEDESKKINDIIKRIENLERREFPGVDKNKMYHLPAETTSFLKQFKENTALKFTTHIWDDTEYDTIENFIKKLNEESKKYLIKLFNINRDLYNLINYFIYTPSIKIDDNGVPERGWTKYNEIKIGWQYPNSLLINWCKENFDDKEDKKYPFQYPLPENLRPQKLIKGKMITTFENVVDVFKTEIQFRDDYLLSELRKREKKSIYDFKGLEKFKGLNFYTYTTGVLSAMDAILAEIKKNETAKNIFFDYEINNSELRIDIKQEDSYPFQKNLYLNNPSDFIGGGLNSISSSLFGLCDFSVISQFKDENNNYINGELLINYDGTEGIIKGRNINLTSQLKFRECNEIINGFIYRLKFYL